MLWEGKIEMENKNTFEYTYSAKQQEEIIAIKKKYMPDEEDKMETLRRLDKSVERPATIWSIAVGVVGILIMGGGMSMVMVGPGGMLIPGIIIGVFGMIVMAVAYPIYKSVTKRQRELLGPHILALTEELLK